MSVILVAIFCLVMSAPVASPGGIVIDARSRAGIAGAQVIVLGYRGAERTDESGHFRWTTPPPPAPLTIIVILPDGHVARPIRLLTWEPAGDQVLVAEATVTEGVTIAGVAPTIDTAPAASTTFLPAADLDLRAPATLSQSLENVPGVSFIAEGQGAVPAIRGLARGRSLIVLDGSRVSTERRAGANGSLLDPADISSIEIARGPGSVAYGSDAFGGVIAVRTRRPDDRSPMQARVSGTLGGGVPGKRGEIELSGGYGSGGMLVDTVSIPRNGGRVVFRMRFADYTGSWIHHCHILMHEDMGMMQQVECVASAASCNANPRDRVAAHGMTDGEVTAIYPRPSIEIAYRQGLSFVDPNPNTGQVFPGFDLEVPKLVD